MYQTTVSVPKVTAEDIRNLHRDYPFTKSQNFEIVDNVKSASAKAVNGFNINADRYEYVSDVLNVVENTQDKSYEITLRIYGD